MERRKIYFFVMVKKSIGEKGGKYLEMEILFHAEEKNIEERKVRKYLEKENIIFGGVGGVSQGVGEGGPLHLIIYKKLAPQDDHL